jgi:hypothetical protein
VDTVEKNAVFFGFLIMHLINVLWSVRPRRGSSMQKMLPLLDSILIPYHRDVSAEALAKVEHGLIREAKLFSENPRRKTRF